MKAKMQARKKKDEGAQPEEEKKQSAGTQVVLSDDVQRDYLASASRDKTIKIWEVRNSRCVITLVGHDNWVTDLVFHPSGKYLLSSSDDKSIRVWDLSNGRCYRKIQNAHDHFVSTIDMKPKVVVTGSVDKTLKVWNCR
jgi:platelet-activating factor acetylhydrolase IB subunit alpha